MEKKAINSNWKKFSFEFLSIFIAVISAFALNNWNSTRQNNLAESKILLEIYNGLEKDLADINENIGGHKMGIRACDYWKNIANGKVISTDSTRRFFHLLTRNFISVQNTSGYETMKSKGFEILKNDSLRAKIISIYEYDYEILSKLEEQYNELQFHKNYFQDLNDIVSPNFTIDTSGNISGLKLPLSLKEKEKNKLLAIIFNIKMNRNFILREYEDLDERIRNLRSLIKYELNLKP